MVINTHPVTNEVCVMGTGQLDQECRKAYIEDAERSLDLGSE
jgi:hypothetical protein